MSWNSGYGNTAGLSELLTYDQARIKFKNTVKIGGRDNECRPLGKNRRADHMVIRENLRAMPEEGNPLGKWVKTYSAELTYSYQSQKRSPYDCTIEYFPDGDIKLVPCRLPSPTAFSFFNYTLSSIGEVCSASGKWYFCGADSQSYLLGDGVTLRPTGERKAYYNHNKRCNTEVIAVMEIVNKVQEHKYRANRKAMNDIKKRYKKFIEYATTMYAMDERVPANELGWEETRLIAGRYSANEARINRDKLFKQLDKYIESGDLTIAFNAAVLIGKNAGYSGNHCTKGEFTRRFQELLKLKHHKEVFTLEPVPLGEAFYDPNAKYFK